MTKDNALSPFGPGIEVSRSKTGSRWLRNKNAKTDMRLSSTTCVRFLCRRDRQQRRTESMRGAISSSKIVMPVMKSLPARGQTISELWGSRRYPRTSSRWAARRWPSQSTPSRIAFDARARYERIHSMALWKR